MNIKRYREQLARDLDRWIANGWVPAASRDLILADVSVEAAGRTSLWLGMIGVTLAGLAIVAGIADNWSVIPRAFKLILLVALIWASLGGAIVAGARGRPNMVNGLTLLASLIFAASIGLLGQSLNIPGDPDNALLLAAVGAGLLSLAAESIAAGIVYLAFVAMMYWAASLFSEWNAFSPGDSLRFALFLGGGAVLAVLLRSRLLAHGTLLLLGALVLNNAAHILPGHLNDTYAATCVWAVAGAIGFAGVLRGFPRQRHSPRLVGVAWARSVRPLRLRRQECPRAPRRLDRDFDRRHRPRGAAASALGAGGGRLEPDRVLQPHPRRPRPVARRRVGGVRLGRDCGPRRRVFRQPAPEGELRWRSVEQAC